MRISYRLRVLEVQDVRLDPRARRVWRGDREIVLSRKEFDLLHALIAAPGDIVTRDELMRDVWDTTFWTSSKTIDVHLGWVRRKLGDDSRQPHADHHDPRSAACASRPAHPSRSEPPPPL